jgi:protein subunit release factor B
VDGTFVGPEKAAALKERMSALGIRESDMEERFVRARGRGGQKLNKTSSCVHLRHVPSGIEVKCDRTRSREANRFFARRLLADRLEQAALGKDSSLGKKASRIRKQKARRHRRSVKKTLSAGSPGRGGDARGLDAGPGA